MKLWTKVEEPADVRVILPYVKATKRLQMVVDCLRIQQVQPELRIVDDGEAYWQLFRDEWKRGEEFFIVEHDVMVWMGAIQQLHDCPETWCTLPSICHGRMMTTTLGCVKFGAGLIERNPDFWDDIPSTWFHLDANFSDKMGWPYIRPHSHNPPATHLNEIQWPDSISRRWAVQRKLAWASTEEGTTAVRLNYRMEEQGRRFWRKNKEQRLSFGPADITTKEG